MRTPMPLLWSEQTLLLESLGVSCAAAADSQQGR